MEILDRLWRGEIRLALTYWGFGIVAPAVLLGPFWLLGAVGARRGPPGPGEAPSFPVVEMLMLGYFLFFLAALIFVAVAVWRSADRYRGPRHWPLLAKGSLFAGAALLGWKMFAGG